MKKTFLIDASSAILLFKTNWMASLLDHYQVGIGPTVYRESTVPGHPGAEAFARWRQEERLSCTTRNGTAAEPPTALKRLDPGERECIDLYGEGAGRFVMLDDGPAAAFCRRCGHSLCQRPACPPPFDPAPGPRPDGLKNAVLAVYAEGHYASWVLEYALTCPDEDLAFFLP